MALIYILGDGDRVRDWLDRLLLNERLDELSSFSKALTAAVRSLASAMGQQVGADVFVAGGDDVVARVSSDRYSVERLQTLADNFRDATGCTISFGVAPNVTQAFVALRRAKAQGGGCVVAQDVAE